MDKNILIGFWNWIIWAVMYLYARNIDFCIFMRFFHWI